MRTVIGKIERTIKGEIFSPKDKNRSQTCSPPTIQFNKEKNKVFAMPNRFALNNNKD